MVGSYRSDEVLTFSKPRTANSVLAFVICVYGVAMKRPLTYFTEHIQELLHLLLVLVPYSQCSNYMQARVCRAPSLLVRAPILSEIFGVQRGPALAPTLRLRQVHMSGRQRLQTSDKAMSNFTWKYMTRTTKSEFPHSLK